MIADAYLPIRVRNLPIEFAFDGARLRAKVRDYVNLGVVRVHAGPHSCDLTIDIKRPYYRPRPLGDAS
jgi:hypothetical protein